VNTNTNIVGQGETLPFGIRCERDGTGRLSPAVAWFKELGEVQRFATLQAAEQVACSLNKGALPCCRYVARAFAEGLGDPQLAPPESINVRWEANATSEAFVQWCRDHKGLAEAVCKAKAFAQAERERVYKYILPIFESFNFVSAEGDKVKDPDRLYLCEDEARVQEFYDKADEAHRAHGFTGEAGVWPNLQADSLLTYAENALLDAACKFFGIRHPVGQKREQFLKLTLSACLNVPKLATGSKQS
jgi:hypothetical protein